jgi:CHAT domain-containing protein
MVLSACDTALGANVAGEGLIGLRYVVLARGARSVLASLWQVPDEATVTLMTRFYSSLLRDKSSLISASSSAMRAMLESKMTDPGWWAAFALTVRE